MNLKKILILFLFCVFCVSCSHKSEYTVGYLNLSQDRPRFVEEGNFMIEKLKEHDISTITRHADDNDVIQIEQGYELLAEGVDLLVIAAVNGNTIAPLVRDARAQGVKVIAYNMLINNCDYEMFVTIDNEEIAKIFCKGAIDFASSGNYVILAGDRFDRNGFEIKTYVDSLLKPYVEAEKINILYESYVEAWNKERATCDFQQVVDSYGLDIDAVISCNDPMGLGVIDVLKKYGKESDVFVCGQDALLEAIRSVYRGEMNLTVYHPHKELGYKAADLVAAILKEGKKPETLANSQTFNGTVAVSTFRVKSKKIDSDNIHDLVELGEFSWDEIR